MTSLENAIEKSIDIHAPVSAVYDQWGRFEEFPKFMEGVDTVERIDEKRLRWHATIEGRETDWVSEITEQTPDTRITWTSAGSAVHTGMVSFATIYQGTRVTLQMSHDPTLPANRRDALAQRTARNLERFKAHIEAAGHAAP